MTFYLDPREIDARALAQGIQTVLLARAGGAALAIDPAQTAIAIDQEHPPVGRMEGDLGAICEVYRESSTYYLSLPGVLLVPGDRLTLTYHDKPYTVTLRVAEIENARARIDPPLLSPADRDA